MANRRTPEEIQKAKEVAQQVMRDRKRKDGQKNIRRARGTLIFLAILQALVGLYEGFGPSGLMWALAIDVGIGAIFLVLYFFSKTRPVAAFSVALIVYGGIHLLLFAFEPVTLFQGIILKIVVISFLITGLNGARKFPEPIKIKNDELLDDESLEDI